MAGMMQPTENGTLKINAMTTLKTNLPILKKQEATESNGGSILSYAIGWLDYHLTQYALELGKEYTEHPEDAPPA